MAEELSKMLDLAFFHEAGFNRSKCVTCGNFFWSLDHKRTNCGDSSCAEYSFLGKPLSKKKLTLTQMRRAFIEYWESKGHTAVKRYPVVARWRDDLYLNIASIANYQPHTTSGEVPPPANPLVVSQPCIRLNDLSNIGRSGRHFSCFEMMGHHAFNSAEWGEYYWTEDCVRNGHGFLVDILGLEPKSLTYVENYWSGGGNAGPCLEVFAGGLEVATLVFMCLEEADDGEYSVKGEKYRMMPLRIVDTGWGLERLAWASTGTPTAYDTVFPEAIAKIRELATVELRTDAHAQKIIQEHARVQGLLNLDIGTKLDGLRQEVVNQLNARGIKTDLVEVQAIMGPVESLYALADHLRCLGFMVGDGIVPGNVKAGYLMRLLFRRAFRFLGDLGISTSLSELLVWNLKNMLHDFPEFGDSLGRAKEMADLEFERYIESRDRGLRLVERTIAKKKELTTEDLVEFYDTHGLGPNTVAEAAAKLGIVVEIPDTFDALIAERHSKQKKVKQAKTDFGTPATELLFYSDQDCQEFEAKIVWAGKHQGKPAVVLNKTAFFWETGGQPGDRGHLRIPDTGISIEVVGMRKDGDHAVHILESESEHLHPGAPVEGVVDWDLRMDHTRSHTATHIMNQSVRRILGAHSWQAGTQKYQDCARVDMTHYRRPTQEELNEIEFLANKIVMEGREVKRTWWNREEAETKYGMTLLQGGIPKGRRVRVVEIVGTNPEEPFDVEYCGGTHCHTTSEVGPVKVWRTERVQDGVERFEYSAGLYAAKRWQAADELLRASSDALTVSPAELPNASKRFFDEWKDQRKLIDELQVQLAELRAKVALGEAESVGQFKLVIQSGIATSSFQSTANEITKTPGMICILAGADGQKASICIASSANVTGIHAGKILQEAIAIVGGRGGGRPDFAQGAGDQVGKLDDAVAFAAKQVRTALK